MDSRDILSVFVLIISISLWRTASGGPLKFPGDQADDGRSLISSGAVSSSAEVEARFHHHQKNKKKKKPCRPHGHSNRFKRDESTGRFFFPILNYYDTNIVYANGGGGSSGCEEGSGGGLGSGLGGLGGGLGSGFGGLGGGLGSGFGGLGGGLGNGLSSIGNGVGGVVNSIGNLGSSVGSFWSQPVRPDRPSGPPAAFPTRPPPVTTSRPTFLPSRPTFLPPGTQTTEGGGGGDNEDYDYTDFGSSEKPAADTGFFGGGNRPSRPGLGSFADNIKPVYEQPQGYFNRYVVRPINRTLREFYSLF